MKENAQPKTSASAVQTTTPTPAPLPRKAVSLKEAADMLGISYISAYRLTKRGLLKSSNVLRKKMIPVTELDRLLRETTSLAE